MTLVRNNNENSIDKYKFIYHFIPHKHEKVRARLLTNRALVTYTFVQILFVVLIRVLPGIVPGVLGYASNINVNDLLRYTNEERAKVGLKPLTLNQKLSSAAYGKANDMFEVGYWAHVSPRGSKPWDFILGQAYDYVYAGENLAKNFSNSKDVVKAWYNSPSHRDNLLSANYDDIGFAVVNGVLNGYETTIVVQMMGRERIASAPVAVAVPSDASSQQSEALLSEPVEKEAELTGIPNYLAKEIPVEAPDEVKLAVEIGTNEPVLPKETDAVVEGDTTPILRQLTSSSNIVVANSDGSDPLIDIKSASRTIIYMFGVFMVVLLGIDVLYSQKHGILKVTGHTMAHLLFLIVVLVSVVLVIVPGSIL